MSKTSFFRCVLHLLFPPKCPYCQQTLSQDQPMCAACAKKLQGQKKLRRIGCANNGDTIWCVAPFAYRESVREAVKRFKFGDKVSFASSMGWSMADEAKVAFGDIAFDCITCVPLSKRSYQKRGYNQARLLAQEAGKHLKLPYQECLQKAVETPAQHTLTRKQRLVNVVGAYQALDHCKIRGKSILLCDDVVTTGSTLLECSRVLYDAGAAQVQCVVLASANYVP